MAYFLPAFLKVKWAICVMRSLRIQIVSFSNYPQSQCCAGGFVEPWQRGIFLLVTLLPLLTPECSVWPLHCLSCPGWSVGCDRSTAPWFIVRHGWALCIYCTIQHGTTALLKKYVVKHVKGRTLLQASTKQNETQYSEKGNYSEATYESCRWTQYVVEWLTRKHSRWPPNNTWTIWYQKTGGIILVNVAVL